MHPLFSTRRQRIDDLLAVMDHVEERVQRLARSLRQLSPWDAMAELHAIMTASDQEPLIQLMVTYRNRRGDTSEAIFRKLDGLNSLWHIILKGYDLNHLPEGPPEAEELAVDDIVARASLEVGDKIASLLRRIRSLRVLLQ